MSLYLYPPPFFSLSHSAGYPIAKHFAKHDQSTMGGFNLGGINASGQVRRFPKSFSRLSSNINKSFKGSLYGRQLGPDRPRNPYYRLH